MGDLAAVEPDAVGITTDIDEEFIIRTDMRFLHLPGADGAAAFLFLGSSIAGFDDILQKVLVGSPEDGLIPIPLVLGVTATPQRFCIGFGSFVVPKLTSMVSSSASLLYSLYLSMRCLRRLESAS